MPPKFFFLFLFFSLSFRQPKQLADSATQRTPVSALCKQMLLAQTSLDVQAEGLKINPAGNLNF